MNGQWGTVCAPKGYKGVRDFSEAAARVACRELGFGGQKIPDPFTFTQYDIGAQTPRRPRLHVKAALPSLWPCTPSVCHVHSCPARVYLYSQV